MIDIRTGDCLTTLDDVPDHSVDSLVADPPAGIAFMGRGWDGNHGHRDRWIAFWCARFELARQKVKPGAHAMIWALPRTEHWTATAIENAGWEIRDSMHHVFGQGWNKDGGQLRPAHEVWIIARAPLSERTIAANIERWGVGELFTDACRVPRGGEQIAAHHGTARALWGGGTDAYKPGDAGKITRTDGSLPTNQVFSHTERCEECGVRKVRGDRRDGGTGARPGGFGNVGAESGTSEPVGRLYGAEDGTETVPAFECLAVCLCGATALHPAGGAPPTCGACGQRMEWACPVAALDEQSGERPPGWFASTRDRGLGYGRGVDSKTDGGASTCIGDSGGASRFFHCFTYLAKASSRERDLGLDDFFWRVDKRHPFGFVRVSREEFEALPPAQRATGNTHATVKPIKLFEHLQRLTTPPGGTTLDITMGSGTSAIAAHRLGLGYIGRDTSPEAIEIARARLRFWQSVKLTATTKTIRKPGKTPDGQGSLFG